MYTLKAEKRSMDVKAKKLRREGFVTGNLYGKDFPGSVPLKMKQLDASSLLKTSNKGSQIMLDIEGKTYEVLIKDIVFNSMVNRIEEIDFQTLVSNEKVHSVAEIIMVNADKVVSGVPQETLKEIAYRALPSALIDRINIDVGDMKVGDTLRVRDLDIAKNKDITLITPLDDLVITVTAVHNNVPVTEEEAAE